MGLLSASGFTVKKLPTQRSRGHGVTLFEMLIVVAIIALCASIAIPNANTVTPFRADAVAGEIARTLRFAQREAIRTNAWYQVKFDTTAQTVRVYRLVISKDSATEDLANPTVNPIDKQAYALNFKNGPVGGVITSVSFNYGPQNTTALTLSFDSTGTPGDIQGNKPKDTYVLVSGGVTIANGSQKRKIDIDPLTGRVAITSG